MRDELAIRIIRADLAQIMDGQALIMQSLSLLLIPLGPHAQPVAAKLIEAAERNGQWATDRRKELLRVVTETPE